MRKLILFLLCFIFTSQLSVQALSWAYPFVVWKGNVYEVTDEEVSDIGDVIGKVKRGTDEMTGEYFGDASNMYPKGTKYYEIKGISPKIAIAVEVEESKWYKADYVHEAPKHWLENVIIVLTFVMLIVAVFTIMIRMNNRKT
ncbi:hypothetical protein ACFFHH_04580 [Cytobacillus solani]|uniref:Uncharacterized protein n=1 Tax=Cytobacillus solani TaxID=1637975 RepID=A0A0Q3VFJ7_9BACI|nr:hypothetical protein [Cytobacillus solani]KOP71185.1 hypothetical protein AMS60_24380 [Bacillus sp. FJAT-21945]KQL17871.1 hypothetical protein AN957_04110 [Cytobacillus solani]